MQFRTFALSVILYVLGMAFVFGSAGHPISISEYAGGSILIGLASVIAAYFLTHESESKLEVTTIETPVSQYPIVERTIPKTSVEDVYGHARNIDPTFNAGLLGKSVNYHFGENSDILFIPMKIIGWRVMTKDAPKEYLLTSDSLTCAMHGQAWVQASQCQLRTPLTHG